MLVEARNRYRKRGEDNSVDPEFVDAAEDLGLETDSVRNLPNEEENTQEITRRQLRNRKTVKKPDGLEY